MTRRSCFAHQFEFFVDHIAPKLGVYEQTVYLFLLRQVFNKPSNETTVGIKSARKKMGLGVGDSSKPMSETTATKCVNSLAKKGLLEKLGSTRSGTRLRIVKPLKATQFAPSIDSEVPPSIEDIDFFADPRGRKAILERERWKCFYCGFQLRQGNHVMEHVVSRPEGDNSFRNIVAACLSCNNRKSNVEANVYIRTLYRESLLGREEFSEKISRLKLLSEGKLMPILPQ